MVRCSWPLFLRILIPDRADASAIVAEVSLDADARPSAAVAPTIRVRLIHHAAAARRFARHGALTAVMARIAPVTHA